MWFCCCGDRVVIFGFGIQQLHFFVAMNVSLFSNIFSSYQKAGWQAVKNQPEDLTSAQSPRVSTNNSSDIVTSNKNNLRVAKSTYTPPSLVNKAVAAYETQQSKITDTTISDISEVIETDLPESAENLSPQASSETPRTPLPTEGLEFYLSLRSSESALYSPYIYDKYVSAGNSKTTINQFLSFLYTPNTSDENTISNERISLINKELSAHVAQQKDGSYCIGVIGTKKNNNSSNEYTNPTDAEKIIIAKLTENNISLGYKEGFVIKISTEGKFTLGDHNISDKSKVAEIENMIQNDESLQSELSNIAASCLSQSKSHWLPHVVNENGNIVIGGSDSMLPRLTIGISYKIP
ncbi:MAG: hypothetical protein LBJ00_11840 [Planctomycetaceae bacterium]|jgi:hypothetical protein|nr:hypothetical protein [Planctomycetaceae bacterium]